MILVEEPVPEPWLVRTAAVVACVKVEPFCDTKGVRLYSVIFTSEPKPDGVSLQNTLVDCRLSGVSQHWSGSVSD